MFASPDPVARHAEILAARDRRSPEMVRFGLTALMRDEMIDRLAAAGACTTDDLVAAGFALGEIAALADDAKFLATIKAVRPATEVRP